jgi:ubiquinone/menaquinone biosynthesis C-methylase UbiE
MPGWDGIAEDYELRVEPFTASFVNALLSLGAAPPPSHSTLLDVGCGCGALAFAALEHGYAQVTATDDSQSMVARLVSRRGASTSIDAVVADGQALPEAWSNSFNVVASNFGVIFFADVPLGLAEMARCAVPGGSVLVSAWGPPEETEAFNIIPAAAEIVVPAKLQSAAKPKRADGTPSALKATLEAAGLIDVHIHGPITREIEVASPSDYWDRFALAAPGFRALLLKLDDETIEKLRARVISMVAERCGGSDGPVRLPASAYFAMGHKPLRASS